MKTILAVLASILLLAVAPVASAYDGHNDPVEETHHYAGLSDGCDMGFHHDAGKDGQGANLVLFVKGTCAQTDKDLVDACGRALPGFVADDLDPFWDDMTKCPAGSEADAPGHDPFYQDLYRAYVLFLQGQ